MVAGVELEGLVTYPIIEGLVTCPIELKGLVTCPILVPPGGRLRQERRASYQQTSIASLRVLARNHGVADAFSLIWRDRVRSRCNGGRFATNDPGRQLEVN